MPYEINGELFKTKQELKDRCIVLRDKTAIGDMVSPEEKAFLLSLFEQHNEWAEKSRNGVKGITTGKADQGTTCFYIVPETGSKQVDISFHHIINKCIQKK